MCALHVLPELIRLPLVPSVVALFPAQLVDQRVHTIMRWTQQPTSRRHCKYYIARSASSKKKTMDCSTCAKTYLTFKQFEFQSRERIFSCLYLVPVAQASHFRHSVSAAQRDHILLAKALLCILKMYLCQQLSKFAFRSFILLLSTLRARILFYFSRWTARQF